jgi:hypothetical protein
MRSPGWHDNTIAEVEPILSLPLHMNALCHDRPPRESSVKATNKRNLIVRHGLQDLPIADPAELRALLPVRPGKETSISTRVLLPAHSVAAPTTCSL